MYNECKYTKDNLLAIEQLFERTPYRSIVNVIYILYIYVDIKYIFYLNSWIINKFFDLFQVSYFSMKNFSGIKLHIFQDILHTLGWKIILLNHI